MIVESDTVEFEQEISRLRKQNHELQIKLDESSKIIAELQAAKASAATNYEATIKHLKEHLAEVTAQQERDKDAQQKKIGEYTSKITALERQLTEKEKEFYLENKKNKAINSKRQSAMLVNNLTNLHTMINSQTELGSKQDNMSQSATRSRLVSETSNKQPRLGEWANDRQTGNTKFLDQELPINERSQRLESVKGKAHAPNLNDSGGDFSPALNRTNSKKDNKNPFQNPTKEQIPEADENSNSGSRSKQSKSISSRASRSNNKSADFAPRLNRVSVSKNLRDLANPFGLQSAALKLAQGISSETATPQGAAAQYLDVIEQLQHQLKCEESEKKQLIEECQRCQQTISHLSSECMMLHKNIMQIEEEKLEILSHAEDYHSQITNIEKHLAQVSSERTRLEARLAQHTDNKVSDESEVQLLKGKLAEAQASLTEMQIMYNRLDSDLKERAMDHDSATRRAKDMINELNARIETLKNENEALLQRCEDLALQAITQQQNFDLEKIDIEKTSAMNQIKYEAKINELEQMVKSMTDQQNLHNKNGNKKEKDYNDDLFSVSCMSRSVKPIGIPDNKSMFSFAQNEHHNNNQTIPEPHNWHDDDNNSQMMAKEILRKGSGIFDRQNAKENDMLAGNFAGEGDTRVVQTKPPSKRGSVVSFGAPHSIESIRQSRRLSYNVGLKGLAGLGNMAIEDSPKVLSKFANIDDVNEDAESVGEKDENNDRFLNLIDQLNEKSEALTKLQAEYDILKTELTALRNELDVKAIAIKNLQDQMEMNEKTYQASKAQTQVELDRITQNLIQLKTKYNEVESQKDLESLVYTKTLRSKNLEISLLRQQLDEVAQAVRRKTTLKPMA